MARKSVIKWMMAMLGHRVICSHLLLVLEYVCFLVFITVLVYLSYLISYYLVILDVESFKVSNICSKLNLNVVMASYEQSTITVVDFFMVSLHLRFLLV